MVSLQNQREGKDHRAIKAAIDDLQHGTEDFAARRMDKNIRAALTGRYINQFKV